MQTQVAAAMQYVEMVDQFVSASHIDAKLPQTQRLRALKTSVVSKFREKGIREGEALSAFDQWFQEIRNAAAAVNRTLLIDLRSRCVVGSTDTYVAAN